MDLLRGKGTSKEGLTSFGRVWNFGPLDAQGSSPQSLTSTCCLVSIVKHRITIRKIDNGKKNENWSLNPKIAYGVFSVLERVFK
ncbi:hypothetical protein CR513_21720, partial [Mucuna pruriens]